MEAEAKHRIVDLRPQGSEPIRIAYQDFPTKAHTTSANNIILLLHGFPQTSHQFRNVVPLFNEAGYRCLVPDYRGAGRSSKPTSDFRKSTMAADMIALLDHLQITKPIHVVGHDIGGMIAFALATRYAHRVKTVCWGECPLPGTEAYYRDRTEHAVQQFHFIFHSVPDLPEALVAGKERTYITHFLSKITYNTAAFGEEDIDHYVAAYSQPGAMRCAFGMYRAFEVDAAENQDWLHENGRCQVTTLVLSGKHSRHKGDAQMMAEEVTDPKHLINAVVAEAGHYLVEENASGFADVILSFIGANG